MDFEQTNVKVHHIFFKKNHQKTSNLDQTSSNFIKVLTLGAERRPSGQASCGTSFPLTPRGTGTEAGQPDENLQGPIAPPTNGPQHNNIIV